MTRTFKLYLFLLALFIFSNSHSQSINKAVGLRFTTNYFAVEGLKQLSNSNYIDGQLAFIKNGIVLTGLYEAHYEFEEVNGLFFKYGLGAHAGIWLNDTYKDPPYRIGMDAILGFNLVLPDLPFVIGINWKPAVDFIGDYDFFGNDLGLSLLFILNKTEVSVNE